MIRDRVCTIDDDPLFAYEYGMSLKISALIKGFTIAQKERPSLFSG